jgi:hypothetical protein
MEYTLETTRVRHTAFRTDSDSNVRQREAVKLLARKMEDGMSHEDFCMGDDMVSK